MDYRPPIRLSDMEEKKNHESELPQQQPRGQPGFQLLFGGANEDPKACWPELVGKTQSDAVEKIKADFPGADVRVIPSNNMVTADYRPDRVHIFVDSSGLVARAPRKG